MATQAIPWAPEAANSRRGRDMGAMAFSNVETYRAGHEAFNQRDFAAMTKQYADRIAWTDHPRGRTFCRLPP